MKSRRPARITVEYDDGSTSLHEISAAGDSGEVVGAIEAAIALEEPAGECGHVMVEWKDGWTEVFAVAHGPIEMRKYQVIERVESVGRLYLDGVASYPELIEINRKPHEIHRVTVL